MRSRQYQAMKRKGKDGPAKATIERLLPENDKPVWEGTCRVCGMRLRGTVAELQAHTHG